MFGALLLIYVLFYVDLMLAYVSEDRYEAPGRGYLSTFDVGRWE